MARVLDHLKAQSLGRKSRILENPAISNHQGTADRPHVITRQGTHHNFWTDARNISQSDPYNGQVLPVS